MQYTVWSRGRLIGETALGFRRFDSRVRSGAFVPNAEGQRVMPVISAVPAAMHAYLRRYCLDELPPEGGAEEAPSASRGSTLFADLAESFQHLHALELELRRPDGTRVPAADIAIIDAWRLMDLSMMRESVEDALAAGDAGRADDLGDMGAPWECDDGLFTTASFDELGLDDIDDPDDFDALGLDGGLCLTEEDRPIVPSADGLGLMAPEIEAIIGRFQIQVMLEHEDAIP